MKSSFFYSVTPTLHRRRCRSPPLIHCMQMFAILHTFFEQQGLYNSSAQLLNIWSQIFLSVSLTSQTWAGRDVLLCNKCVLSTVAGWYVLHAAVCCRSATREVLSCERHVLMPGETAVLTYPHIHLHIQSDLH